MKKVFALVTSAAAGLLLLALLIGAMIPRYPSLAEIEAERLTIERMHAIAPAQTAAAAIWALLPPLAALGFVVVGLSLSAGWGMAALRRYKSRELVRPDSMGLLPVVYEQLPSVAPAALAGYHQARAIEAARQPVPASYAPHISYAPHSDYRADASRVSLLAADEPAALAAPSLPGSVDLAELDHTPSAQSILLGLAPGGGLLTVAAKDLCHVALCGATGQGKSNMLRLIVPQLQAMGARVVLADPHYAPIDPESGDDWRGIAARLHLAPAQRTPDIAALLGWLSEELERRKVLRQRGALDVPLFFAFDELPVIIEQVKGADTLIGELLREGRKFRMYTVGASQEFLVKTIGGSSALRDCYRTAAYVGGDLKSASALLDMRERDVAELEPQLGKGVVLLRSKATAPAQLVRVPYASNRAVAGLLGDGSEHRVDFSATSAQAAQRGDLKPSGSQFEVITQATSSAPQSAEVARAAALFAQGLSVGQIVLELGLAKSTSGGAYQKAAEHVQSLLRAAMKGA